MAKFARETSAEFCNVCCKIPWGHIVQLLDKTDPGPMREWYVQACIENGWSRSVLMHQAPAQSDIQRYAFKRKKKLVKGTKVIEMSPDNLAKIRIPVPPLPEQQRIVSILDEFGALATSLTDGLPAEIAARRKQCAYYRDRLLAFPEKPAA